MVEKIKSERPGKTLITLFALLTGASLILEWWTRRCGFIMTHDSIQFLSASRSFRESGVLLNQNGSRFTNWPPLFPLILSLFANSQQALIYITALSKVTISLVAFYFSNVFIKEKVVAFFYLTALLLGVHFLMASLFMWSEIIFMMFLYLNIFAAFKLKDNPSNYYLMVLTGFLFCLQRNVGMFWIASTSLWLWLEYDISWSRRLLKSGGYFIACTSGLWSWNLYNTFFSQQKSIFDDRNYFADTFLNIMAILIELGKSIVPFRGWVAFLFGGLLAIILIYFIMKNFRSHSGLRLLALGLLVYTVGFIPVSYISTDVDRYFVVVLPVVFLLLFMAIESFLVLNHKTLIITTICLTVWVIYPVMRAGQNALLWRKMSCLGVSVK